MTILLKKNWLEPFSFLRCNIILNHLPIFRYPFVTPSTITQLYVAASVSMLVYYNSIRRRHYLTRTGILPTSVSPWRHLYENGDDGSFLNLTGFNRDAFEEMYEYLYEIVEDHTGAGHPRLLNTRDELGLILFFSRFIKKA